MTITEFQEIAKCGLVTESDLEVIAEANGIDLTSIY
jgi:hypothetical protein